MQDYVKIGADIGGTFTDIVLETPAQRLTTKVLTTYDAPERGLLDGTLSLLDEAGLQPHDVTLIVHGTTLATNALIERRGARTGLLTTEGFRDVLEIGTEGRFDQYDLTIEKPAPLIPRNLRCVAAERSSATGEILLPLDRASVEAAAAHFATEGVEAVAIAFLHSFANPLHEQQAGEILRAALPGVEISLSCEVSPEIREYERFSTTAANAYVQPVMARYLRSLAEKLRALRIDCPLFMMLSSGGLTTLETAIRFPVRLVESGPAGGAIFASETAQRRNIRRMLAFDMGGTTAKICFIDDAKPFRSQTFEVARTHRFRKGSGLPLRIPVLEMVEIGAGGGSLASIDTVGRLCVGPHSAGSEPGPACYGRGGTRPTVTDADLLLGRIDPAAFAAGSIPLQRTSALAAVGALGGTGDDPAILALGICDVVDETMASAARVHAVEQGTMTDERSLVAFGGAAPLHATRLAEKLGIKEVIIPRNAGVGSAVGFLHAPIAFELSRSLHVRLSDTDLVEADRVLADMIKTANEIVRRGASGAALKETRTAFARFCGQGYEIPIEVPPRKLTADDAALLKDMFYEAYGRLYGKIVPRLDVEIMTWRVSVATVAAAIEPIADLSEPHTLVPTEFRPVVDVGTGEILDYAVIRRDALAAGDSFSGPALIVEDGTTIVVTPAFDASIDADQNVVCRTRRAERD